MTRGQAASRTRGKASPIASPDLPEIASHLSRRAARTIAGEGFQRAAVALCLREEETGVEALLIHRAEHPEDRWSGHMALPGGRVEPEDGEPRRAAERETLEEVGIDLRHVGRHLGCLDELQAMAKGRMLAMVVTPHVYELTEPVEVRVNEEVQTHVWIPIAPLMRGDHDSEIEWRYGPAGVMLPSFQVGDHTIWGLTYRMLSDFFGRLRD